MKDKPIAICFIRENDENNILTLTQNYFTVKVKGKLNPYDIEFINGLQIKNKQFVVTIVAGAIASCLSVVAYMNDIIHPWLLMFLLLSGIFSMYYGIIGSPALVVHLNKSSEHYLLKEKTIYIENFIGFVNKFVKQKGVVSYFINIDKDDWKKAQINGYIAIDTPRELMEVPEKMIPLYCLEWILKS